MAGNVVNLNRFRKKKAREDRAKQAEENRVRHGRTQAQKDRERLDKERAERLLAGKRLDVTAHRGTRHLVCTVDFDADAELDKVAERLSSLLQAFAPEEGLVVRAARGAKREVLAARFRPTTDVSAAQLARGGTLELGHHHVEPVDGRCPNPIFWVASDPPHDGREDEEAPAALRFGLCLERPASPRAEAAITEALRTFVEACVVLEGCVSAVLTAQEPPVSLASPALAYEAFAGNGDEAPSVAWLRGHVRAPGWLVLVPRDAAEALPEVEGSGIEIERVRGGFLARATTESPFVAPGREVMETWLAPVLR